MLIKQDSAIFRLVGTARSSELKLVPRDVQAGYPLTNLMQRTTSKNQRRYLRLPFNATVDGKYFL